MCNGVRPHEETDDKAEGWKEGEGEEDDSVGVDGCVGLWGEKRVNLRIKIN